MKINIFEEDRNEDYLVFNDRLLKEFQNYCNGRITKTTLDGYSYLLKIFFNYLGENEISRLRKKHIIKILAYISEERSVNMSRRAKDAVKKYFRFLNDYYEANLDESILNVDLPKKIIKEQKSISYDKTLEIIEKISQNKKHSFTNLRNITILILLATTGMRRKEAVNLKLENIDFEEKRIHLNITKGEKKRRIVPLFEIAEKYLKLYLTERNKKAFKNEDNLFINRNGSAMATETIGHIASKICKKYGFNFSLHSFRRGYATDLNKNKVPVTNIAKVLGHDNISTTYKHYIIVDDETMEKVSYQHPAYNDNNNHFNNIAKIYEEKSEEEKIEENKNRVHFNDIVKMFQEREIKEN